MRAEFATNVVQGTGSTGVAPRLAKPCGDTQTLARGLRLYSRRWGEGGLESSLSRPGSWSVTGYHLPFLDPICQDQELGQLATLAQKF